MRTFLFAAAVLMATAAYAQRQASQFVENQVNNIIETTMSENGFGRLGCRKSSMDVFTS